MSDAEIFKRIKQTIVTKAPLNNPYDDTYIRRLQYYPEFLLMPYWLDYMEYKVFNQYLTEWNFEGKVLDFGCGSGHMDVLLARLGRKIHGIDLSPMAIDISNILKEYEGEEVKERVSFSLEDITEDPKTDEKYDVVWSSHTMEHIKDHGPIFDGIRKRVNKGTKMMVSVPLGHAFDDIDHVQHWATANEFKEFFEQFVEVIEAREDYSRSVIVGVFRL